MTTLERTRPLAPHATDFITGTELDAAQVQSILHTAAALKRQPWLHRDALAGRSAVLLFEKPSLRTRLSFEIGIARLGGFPLYVDQQSGRIGQRESISDCAKTIERYTDVIIARTFAHETVEQLAAAASIPVINALSDRFHPCQALADALTIGETHHDRGWSEIAVVYVGDGNNVCHSLMLIAAQLGLRLTVITPAGHAPDEGIVEQARSLATGAGHAPVTLSTSLDEVAGNDVVYTDTWVSMGAEAEAAARVKAFAPYQVTAQVMAAAGPDARFMHCLPAHRGDEVTAEVIDGERSVVFDQAENRMHAQNALLAHLMEQESRK